MTDKTPIAVLPFSSIRQTRREEGAATPEEGAGGRGEGWDGGVFRKWLLISVVAFGSVKRLGGREERVFVVVVFSLNTAGTNLF